MRGYFEIGIYRPKTFENVGTLWRSAYQLGASGIFLIGARFKNQASDTLKTYRHIPLREYQDFDQFQSIRPYDCQLIGVEMRGRALHSYHHPDRAIYLLGSEDNGLPHAILSSCQSVVTLDALGTASYNVAVAGSLIMYHRQFIQGDGA